MIYKSNENPNETSNEFNYFQSNNIVLILAISLLVVFLILLYRRSKYKKHVLFVTIILFGAYITLLFFNNKNSTSNNQVTAVYLKWLEINKEKISAVQMHDQLIELKEFKNNQHRITGKLISGLNQHVNTVLYPLISGDMDELDTNDITYAIKCAEKVIQLYRNSDFFNNASIDAKEYNSSTNDLYLKKYIANKITLETYQTIISDDSTQYKDGLDKIEELKQIDSSSAYVYNMAGIIHEKMNDLENAKINLSIAEQKAPLWIEPIVNHGKIFVKENKIDSAAIKFEYAIKLNSNEIKACNELKKIKALVNNNSKTETNFEMDFVLNLYDNENKYGCVFGNCNNGTGKYIWSDNSMYEGEFKNNMPHGKGKHTDKHGNVVEGEYKEGFVNGYATKIYKDGRKISGIWKDSELIEKE